jgi:hypothetical protein
MSAGGPMKARVRRFSSLPRLNAIVDGILLDF